MGLYQIFSLNEIFYLILISDGTPYAIHIDEVTLGNALFHTKTNTSWLFVGQPVQICLRGRFTRDFPNGLSNLPILFISNAILTFHSLRTIQISKIKEMNRFS